MNLNNIERNQLDYILTDVLPTELSEQFSYHYFYEYLDTKHDEINEIIELIIKHKNENKEVFNGNANWVSMPLGYTIMKQLHSERTISLLQPLGAMQLFLFISAYQKEMLTLLQKNSVFSLRYHKKNNDLYYKNRNKSVTKYFADLSESTGKEIIEQTGMYFNVGPYKSIAAFTSSEEWLVLNSKYKYFIRNIIGATLIERIDAIVKTDSIYTYREFWWVLIFNKSPHITATEQAKIDAIIPHTVNPPAGNAGAMLGKVFVEFLRNSTEQFFEWDINKTDFLRNITFKTRQRSIFKNYQENLSSLYWSSI